MISAFLSIGYVASIKMFETYVLAWWMAMFFLIGLPVVFLVWGFLFWTVFVSSISPIRNGASNRLSDIILVPKLDDRRRLEFPKGLCILLKTSLENQNERGSRAGFPLITPSRSEISTEGIRHHKAITFSGKMSCPYYILNFPFLGTLCKLLIFGFFWEYKGWGLGGLNLAWLWMPTLGDEKDAITVKFCEDGIEEEKMPVQTAKDSVQSDFERPIVTGKLVVVGGSEENKEDNQPFFSRLLPGPREFWTERIFHCVHYDEKGASVYIVHAWRLKLFHPLRGIFTSRFTHGAHWMMNADGTISPLKNSKLVLGIHPNIKHACQRPEGTPTSEALKQYFKTDRQDLMQFCKVFDDHCITPDQLKHLTFETLFRDMKIPLGHALDMPALFQKPILLSEKPSESLSPRADLIFPTLGSPVVGEFGPRTFKPTALLGTPSTMTPPPPGMLDLYMCDVKDRLACSIEYIYSATPPGSGHISCVHPCVHHNIVCVHPFFHRC